VYERTDPRLAGAHEAVAGGEQEGLTYQRLPGTAREARAVRSVLQGVKVDELSGIDASRERLLQLDWSRYRLIHIASHGHLDAQAPALSALVLSTYDRNGQRIEGALRGADLSSLTLSADLAVFSGCDTALGMDVSNEGMVGIAYSTLARGARAVVSSLWEVPDEIGANLMTELYAHLMRDAMSPMTALSASQRSILVRNPDADPALWAAFQVSVLSP
jgi:CHAT domain-containing protein